MSNRGRLVSVGDIHGNLTKLKSLMDQIQPTNRDKIVFLGDYICYGEDSKGVIDYLLELRKRIPCVFLKGDSEAFLLDALTFQDIPVLRFLQHGGDKAWRSYGGSFGKIPREHLDFFHGLKVSHEEDGFFFVHAGLRPGVPLEKQKEPDLLGIRDTYIYGENEWGMVIVSGHTPTKRARRTKDGRIFLDSGVAWGHFQDYGRLSGCDLRAGQFFEA